MEVVSQHGTVELRQSWHDRALEHGDNALGAHTTRHCVRDQDCYDMPWARTTGTHMQQRNSVAIEISLFRKTWTVTKKKKKTPGFGESHGTLGGGHMA